MPGVPRWCQGVPGRFRGISCFSARYGYLEKLSVRPVVRHGKNRLICLQYPPDARENRPGGAISTERPDAAGHPCTYCIVSGRVKSNQARSCQKNMRSFLLFLPHCCIRCSLPTITAWKHDILQGYICSNRSPHAILVSRCRLKDGHDTTC